MSWTSNQPSNKPLMPLKGSSGGDDGKAAAWLKGDTNFDDSDDPKRSEQISADHMQATDP